MLFPLEESSVVVSYTSNSLAGSESYNYLIRFGNFSQNTLPLASFKSFGQSLPMVLGQRLASALDRCHVIAIRTKPLVLVGWSPRVSACILNAEDDNGQDDGGEHGGDDDGGRHCVRLSWLVVCYTPHYIYLSAFCQAQHHPNGGQSSILFKVFCDVTRCHVRGYGRSACPTAGSVSTPNQPRQGRCGQLRE